MPGLTRRQSIIALTAAGGTAALAGFGLLVDHRESLVRAIIEDCVGEFQMSDEQFSALLQDLDTQHSGSQAKAALYRVVAATDPDTLLKLTPGRVSESFRNYERRVVTAFLTRTDFLQIDHKADHVSFVGGEACDSPFAKFTLAETPA